jgi:Bacterial Ig domain
MLHPLSARCRPDSFCDPHFRRPRSSSSIVAAASLVLTLASACVEPTEDADTSTTNGLESSGAPVGSLADDLAAVTPDLGGRGAPTDTQRRASGVAVSSSALTAPAEPAVIYLAYADGSAEQKTSPNPCPGAAPKFVCQFAPTLKACQQQIQAYLDQWYADFNVVFTLTRPASGWYYTEVISSGGGAWCGAKENVGGIAPFLCNDLAGGVSYTFSGGRTAKETAVIIAQEQAHLVGLEHSASTHDVMYPTICSDCDGFENVDNKVQGDVCGRPQQNSYQLLHDRLGAWTGGVKPTPFGCTNDMSSPSVTILEPSDKATVDSTFVLRIQASDDCKIAKANIQVTPMGLEATSTKPPYEWTLTRIKGQQKITVSVTDPSNKTSTASITINAPGITPPSGTGGASGTGGRPGAGGPGGATATDDGGALNASTRLPASAASGCEVGGCDIADPGARIPSSLSVLLAGLFMGWLLRRRPPARCRTPIRPRSIASRER